jgi:hypothetical protein
MATPRNIRVARDGGTLAIRLSTPRYPHQAVGILWRFSAQDVFEAKVGRLSPSVAILTIGSPAANEGKRFLIEGAVASMNDDPPTPYEVQVAVLQDSKIVLS